MKMGTIRRNLQDIADQRISYVEMFTPEEYEFLEALGVVFMKYNPLSEEMEVGLTAKGQVVLDFLKDHKKNK